MSNGSVPPNSEWHSVEPHRSGHGEVWPTTREQRCCVHKTANILNKMPKSLHTKAKRALQEIWMAETKKHAGHSAGHAFDVFAFATSQFFLPMVEGLRKAGLREA
jgi:hypothetical protein